MVIAMAPGTFVANAKLYPSGMHSAAATALGMISHRVSRVTVAASGTSAQTAYQGWKTGASTTVAASA